MKIKKGVQINDIFIEDGVITAVGKNLDVIKLTRGQREILLKYNHPDYINMVIKAFSNPKILSDRFTIMKDGKIVYTINT